MSEMHLWVERSALLRSALRTHFPSLCWIQPDPCPAAKKGHQLGSGKFNLGWQPAAWGGQGVCHDLCKGKGREGGFLLGLAQKGLTSRSVHFYTWRKILKIRPSDSHCRLRIQLHCLLLLPPSWSYLGWKKRNVLFFIPLDLNLPKDDNCSVVEYDFIHSFLHSFTKKLFMYLSTPGLSCGKWDVVSWPGVEPRPPDLEVHSLSHWSPVFLFCMNIQNIYEAPGLMSQYI